jgi:pyruvate dehydrogenase E2 component (dihydrolipoamide acetyltransferase)
MRYMFKFPDIGEGIHEGRLLQWHVRKGAAVAVGDPLAKVETDKVVTDIPAPRAGEIAALYGKEGDTIHVGDPLVEIEIAGVAGEEAQQVAAARPPASSPVPVEEKGFGVVGTLEVGGSNAYLQASAEGVTAAPETAAAPQTRVLATPVARAMAREQQIEIQEVKGTGPGGRVTKDDVQRHAASRHLAAPAPAVATAPVTGSAPAAGGIETIPLSQIRKTIARNMTVSKQSAAHMTVFDEVEIAALAGARVRLQEAVAAKGVKLTYLPFILKAVTAALKKNPLLNAVLDLEGGQIVQKKFYHIGIAVDAEQGLVVPVIRDVDKRALVDLAAAIVALAEKARTQKLQLADLQGGTFTVTNYGALGGRFGVPVINYPQVGILGIGRAAEQPVVRDGQLAIGLLLPLSLSVDHRLVDGSTALRFLADVKAYLHDPLLLMLD